MTKRFLVPVLLPANPTQPLEATTKAYADGLVVISATDPIATYPNCELWYDPDAAGVAFP